MTALLPGRAVLDRLRICLVANSRFPIVEPFTGGLESMTWHLAHELIRRGHAVAVFAAPGSDPGLGVQDLDVSVLPDDRTHHSRGGRHDVDAPPGVQVAEHHAYLSLMLDLADGRHGDFDVVHNNSLHYLPVAMAHVLDVPVLTTLHTPPVWWLDSAVRLDRARSTFAAVSRHTAEAWSHITRATCVPNGIDVDRWPGGPGGPSAVWSGRLVPEKAPHEAVLAARAAGMDLVLAGPVLDVDYFRSAVQPLLGGRASYAGHLSQRDLATLVGRSAVALVTPAWDEPFGLVAAEALACGTPVAAYARGGVPEVVTGTTGRLAPPGDVLALASAMTEAAALDRADCRQHAIAELSLSRMVDRYEDLYASLARGRVAA